MKYPKWMWIAVFALAVFLMLTLGTSRYVAMNPGAAVKTDLGDSMNPSAMFKLKTNLGCVPGNTAVGAKSKESYYVQQDGTGYGVCGMDKLVNDQMNYKLLDDNAQLGD